MLKSNAILLILDKNTIISINDFKTNIKYFYLIFSFI
jgi:hypothetical protein